MGYSTKSSVLKEVFPVVYSILCVTVIYIEILGKHWPIVLIVTIHPPTCILTSEFFEWMCNTLLQHLRTTWKVCQLYWFTKLNLWQLQIRAWQLLRELSHCHAVLGLRVTFITVHNGIRWLLKLHCNTKGLSVLTII